VQRGLLWSASVVALLAIDAGASRPSGPMVLTVDAANSQVVILVGKAGVFSFAGHAHEVVAPSVGGRVVIDPTDPQRDNVSLEFDSSALRVTGKDESPADAAAVQQTMLGEKVLDVGRFPKIAFQSRHVSVTTRTVNTAAVTIDGDLTLHGATHPMTIRADVTLDAGDHFTARGAFSFKQTDFGMVPVTAAGGTIRVKDELDVQFVLRGSSAQ
jgi:polyisoprenoid-binding protein YceI